MELLRIVLLELLGTFICVGVYVGAVALALRFSKGSLEGDWM